MIISNVQPGFNDVIHEALEKQKEHERMFIDRENRVKLLKNIGQYIIDNADNIIPKDKPHPTEQTITIHMAVDVEIPTVTVNSSYIAKESLNGVNWSKGF